VTLRGCRNRSGALCATTGTPCDLRRVPEFRCSITTAVAVGCLWPNGAGYCNADPNVGCLTDGMCPSGTCNLNTNDPACICQGTNQAGGDFESIVCGTTGICSDGDGEFNYAPILHGGLATAINFGGGSGNGTNAGRGAGQGFTGPRSGFENPPVLVTGQRQPGQGDIIGAPPIAPGVTPIVDLRSTLVYDIGPIENGTGGTTNRGGIRRIQLKGDSFWQDIPYGDQDITAAPVSSNGPTTSYFFAPAAIAGVNPPYYYNQPTQGTCVGGGNPGTVCIEGGTCTLGGVCTRTLYGHQAALDSIGYIWTQSVSLADPNLIPPTLDVDADGAPDCPPHCGLDYDIDSLEQMTLEALNGIDPRAGAQLSFEYLTGPAAGQGDAIGTVAIESSTWASAGMPDMRCFVGGDPAVVCSTCVGGTCGATGLACVTDADCQQYTGRCASSTGFGFQACDPLDNGTNAHTDCPAGPPVQTCHSCYGPTAVGACVAGANLGLACRVDSQCPGSTCGADTDGGGAGAGSPYYPEVPGPNPLGLPPGYNTYGFVELELQTKCSPTRPGRIGMVSPMPGILPAAPARLVAVPLAFIGTTGKAASQVVDIDTSGGLFDDTIFGRTNLGTIGIAEPGAPGSPLSGGTYAAGRIFPVDPLGPACCNGGGNILGTKNTTFGNARANITVNGAGALTWGAGTQGTIVTTPMRASGWAPGTNQTPGCIGDNSEVTGGSAFPDPDPCNDPLGAGESAKCSGGNCNNLNSGADDPRITASIGGAPAVGVIAARAKTGSPAASTPIIYNVGQLTGIDIDIGAPAGESNTDFSATVETFNCPLRGTCAIGGASCALDTDCAGGANGPCQNRVKACSNIFDFDGDGILPPADTCETIANAGADTDGDLVDNACDTCTSLGNAAIAGAPTANRTFISHQRDDDADGRGNRCDFNYDNVGPTILAGDFNQMKPSVGKLMTASNCGLAPTNNQRCGEFDHTGVGPTVGADDFNLSKAAVGKVENTAFPKCARCNLDPDGAGAEVAGWSNVLGSGGERVNRAVGQWAVALVCTYAP
jgi:hypothetical protein